MSKIKPGKPVSGTQFGTTLSNSDTHAPSLFGSGNTMPKGKIKPNGIMSNEPQGTTFTGNKSKINVPTTEAHGAKVSKVKSSGGKDDFVPKGKGIAYGSGGNGPSVKNPPVKGKR